MKKLSPTWLTDEPIDYEYNKYILLDYIQYIEEQINKKRIYPFLIDLQNHYDQLLQLKHRKMIMDNAFKKDLIGFDFTEYNLLYKEILSDDKYLIHLQKSINFALSKFTKSIHRLTELVDNIQAQLEVDTIGLRASYTNEGFLFLVKNKIYVYEYRINIITGAQYDAFDASKYKDLTLTFVDKFDKKIGYDDIKLDVTRHYDTFIHAAAYVVTSPMRIPLKETYLPLAKKALINKLAYD